MPIDVGYLCLFNQCPKYRGNNLTTDANVEAATFIHRLSKICLDTDEQKVMYDFAHYKVN